MMKTLMALVTTGLMVAALGLSTAAPVSAAAAPSDVSATAESASAVFGPYVFESTADTVAARWNFRGYSTVTVYRGGYWYVIVY